MGPVEKEAKDSSKGRSYLVSQDSYHMAERRR